MLSSKKVLKTFLLGSLLLNTACFRDAVKQETPAEANNNVDFRIISLSGSSQTISGNQQWSLPSAKAYDFRVCLRTKITNSQLGPGHKFHVSRPDKSVFYTSTDKLGCINWQENVPFDMSVDSKYVELNRKIHGNDLYKGVETIKIGVNPWAEFRGELNAEIVNLDEQKLPNSHLVSGPDSELAFSGLYEKSSGEDLLIDDAPATEIQIIKNTSNGKLVRFSVKVRPFIEPLDMYGEFRPYYFKKGLFRVYPQLIANYLGPNGDKRMILMPLLPENLGIARNGMINYQKEVVLSREVTMGQVQLALKVEAINAPMQLNAYEGLHSMGSFENLFGQHSPNQIQGVFSNKSFNYANYVSESNNFENLKKEGLAFDLKPIRFKELGIRFVRVAPGETATRRTIIYRTQTEVVDTITGAPIRKQAFHIKKSLSEQEEVVFTDEDGLLKWQDQISHLFYVAEQFYYPEVELTHQNSNYKETLKMAINPWNSGWTFGSDYRGREAFYEHMNKQEKRDSTFMIDAFRYQTIRFRYEIDEFMTLNVKKAVVMAMDPLTQRYTIEEGRKGGEPLRDGIYLVKLALVKYYIDPFKKGTLLYRDENDVHRIANISDDDETKKGRYITVVKKLLRVQGGRITTPLEFSMRDLRMMSIRSNIMVQIETVDEQKLLRDNIVDRKLRQLVDEYNEYNSQEMSEEEREEFIRRNENLYLEERDKLSSAMEQELADLQKHRELLADREAQRYQALYEFEEKINDQESVHERRARRREILNLNREDFENYMASVRSNLDQMEKTFSDYWKEWNDAMGIPSNEIQDWEQWQDELQAGQGVNVEVAYENPDKERIGLGQNKSVYDYLASMQLFMKDYGLPEELGINDLRAMRLNNYTQNPAAPFIDLDLYRVNAGLKRRTFIGPCTLIENDNMSELRPTDTIDETYCDRIDCSQNLIDFGFEVDNSVFEQSAYHGAIKPFAMTHVDNIIDIYKDYERDYYHGMKALSQMGEFLEQYNLDFVSLNYNLKTPYPKRFKQGCVARQNEGDEYNPNALDHCFEDARENVVPASIFNNRMKKSNSEDLLKEFFRYKKYNENSDQIVRTNTLPSLLDKTGDEVLELTSDTQEELFGGTIGELVNEVFTNDADKAKYIREFERGRLREFDNFALKQLIYTENKSLSLLQATKLCGLLSEGAAEDLKRNSLLKRHQEYQSGSLRGYTFRADPLIETFKEEDIAALIRKKCLKSIEFNPETGAAQSELLAFDQRYRIFETGTYEHKEGKNMNLNVGYDFSVGEGNALSIASGLSINGSVSPLDKVPFVSAAITAGKEVSDSQSFSFSQGSSVSAATFLVVQQATMEIELRKFERCFTANLMPKMYYDLKASDLNLSENHQVTDEDVQRSLTRGIMVCEGRYNREPEKVIENYFYITQHFTAGDMLDDANLLNHVWLLPLRGTRDFNNFMDLVNAKPIGDNGEEIASDDLYFYPNVRLRSNYNQVLPSFPGLYTVQEVK